MEIYSSVVDLHRSPCSVVFFLVGWIVMWDWSSGREDNLKMCLIGDLLRKIWRFYSQAKNNKSGYKESNFLSKKKKKNPHSRLCSHGCTHREFPLGLCLAKQERSPHWSTMCWYWTLESYQTDLRETTKSLRIPFKKITFTVFFPPIN